MDKLPDQTMTWMILTKSYLLLLVILFFQEQVLTATVTTERHHNCSLNDDGTSPDLSFCLQKGRHFIKKFFKAMKIDNPRHPFKTCNKSIAFRECLSNLTEPCPNINKRWQRQWEPIVQHLDCYCNGTQECVDQQQCLQQQYSGVMVKQCDALYKFNVQQNRHNKCRFLRERFACRDALVTSACGRQAGHVSFYLSKMVAQEVIYKTRCNVVRRQIPYSGFRYTGNCGSDFVEVLVNCSRTLFTQSILYFYKNNELVADRGRKSVRRACRAYKDYENCVQPIRDVCPEGTRLWTDYVERVRTYLFKLNYICHQVKQEYMEHLQCYQDVVENSTLSQCDDIWTTGIKPLLQIVTSFAFYCQSNSVNTTRLQEKLETLRECYQEVYRENCGLNASLVMGEFLRLAFRDPYYLRYKYKPDCKLLQEPGPSTTTSFALGKGNHVSPRPTKILKQRKPDTAARTRNNGYRQHFDIRFILLLAVSIIL